MTTNLNKLAAHYSSLADEELLRQRTKELTPEARALADKELQSRGLPTSATNDQPVPASEATTQKHNPARTGFVDIAQLHDPAEAHLLRGYLESYGIPAVVIGADVARTFSSVFGGTRLSVPEPFAEQARHYVAHYNNSDSSLDECPEDDTDLQPDRGLKTYRVYAHPKRKTRIVVRTGFNWAALIFGPLWFLLNKMWVNALIYMALIGGNWLYFTHAHPVSPMDIQISNVMLILYPIGWILFSVFANSLLCSDLESRGYSLKATVRARNPAYAREEARKVEAGT